MATTDSVQLAERLAGIVGTSHVTERHDLELNDLTSLLAVSPGSLDEAARVLRAARDSGAAVTPYGGGTQQRIGSAPERLDILLRTERLREVVEWEPADLTACLQSGISLQSLQERLAERGQQLPIDAPDAASATLGGLVATNTSGPRRWRYGSWRDLIIGMHAALTDGTVIKSGGRVVKNVQGYDLGKLFTGSLGTLCLIGQVNVKLMPLPVTRSLFVGRGPLRRVASFLEAVAASALRVSTIDLLDEAAAKACGLAAGDCAALVLVEDQPPVVVAQSLALQRLAMSASLRTNSVEADGLEPIWRAWLALGRTSDLSTNEALLTVSALPSEVCAIVELIEQLRDVRGLTGRTWARAGDGLVYARLAAHEGSAADALAATQAALLARWPATTITAGDPAVAAAAKPFGAEPAGIEVMRTLKQRFDPTRTLQPGRYAGGI